MRLSAGGGFLAALVGLLGCARMEPPPGGPPDRAPPHLLTVSPDSGAVLPKFGGAVEFRFDEVISEGGVASQGLGTGDLERLVLLSPSTRVPKVRWRRNRLTVAPAEGWKPNRIYRVELLPGITDLRRNRSDTGAVLTFSTGAAAPTTTLTGVVVDWTTRRPAIAALVEAVLLPDSLPYRTLADSSGKFKFGPLPQGDYIVYGILDQNRDLQRGNREAYDSAKIAAAATDAGELWAFVHDTTPVRIDTVAAIDSVSASIRLSQMLDPKQALSAAAVRLRHLPDSSAVAVTSLLPQALDDSLYRRAAPDTARRDTVVTPPPPAPRPGPAPVAVRPELTSRPPLFDQLIMRVAAPWKPGDRFAVEIRGLRNVTGTIADVRGILIIPEPKPALADSLKKLPFPIPVPRKPKP
jgi:hypothetical protein